MPARSAKVVKIVELLAKVHGKEPARNPGSTPLDHLVYGILAHGKPAAKAREAYAALDAAFVDRNELRVAEVYEILPHIASLGSPEECRTRALLLRRVLQGLFDALDRVRITIETPEDAADVARVLGGIPGLPPGLVAAMAARALDGPPPLTNRSTARTGQRLGILPKTSSDTKLAVALKAAGGTGEGPALLAYLLTEHGEAFCLEKAPLCDTCVCAAVCPSAKKLKGGK